MSHHEGIERGQPSEDPTHKPQGDPIKPEHQGAQPAPEPMGQPEAGQGIGMEEPGKKGAESETS